MLAQPPKPGNNSPTNQAAANQGQVNESSNDQAAQKLSQISQQALGQQALDRDSGQNGAVQGQTQTVVNQAPVKPQAGTQEVSEHYVSSYQPPQALGQTAAKKPQAKRVEPKVAAQPQPVAAAQAKAPAQTQPQTATTSPTNQTLPTQPVTQTVQAPAAAKPETRKPELKPQAKTKTAPAKQPSSPPQKENQNEKKAESSEKLEDQNIFTLLGIQDGSVQEKEQFLNELQQVIWEDFLEKDLELLISKEEQTKVEQILANQELSQLQQQEQILDYLADLIPDLEEIMLEKALELKQDMVKERVEGLKQFYAGDDQALAKIEQAQALLAQGKWHSGAEKLNRL